MKKYLPYITAAVCLTLLVGLVYGTAQQLLRLSANDPQIQLAQDTAARLDKGTGPDAALVGMARVDMARSLAPFVIIYDKSGRVLAGNGYISGGIPTIPLGVLQHAAPGKYNAVTWTPQAGLRVASVAASSDRYYVLSGRSLAETESRITTIGWLCLGGWLLLMAVLGGGYAASRSSRL